MNKIQSLVKILKSYSVLLNDVGTSNKNTRELDILIKALEEKENLDFNKLIKTIENIDSKVSIQQKIGIYNVAKIYKKKYSGEILSDDENQIIGRFDNISIDYYINMDEDDFKKIIFSNSSEIKSVEYLKIILYLRYGMEFKGNKSRKNIISEACSLIGYTKYYENMENAYKGIEPK